MCPVFQVKYDCAKLAWRDEILKTLVDSGVGIVQMPCPEASFGGYNEGLSRQPHGVRFYEQLPGFQQHCKNLAAETAAQIIALKNHGFHVEAILGIENSPTCALNRIFTFGVGTEHRSGLFMGALKELLDEKNLNIQLIGITRHKKSQKKEIDLLQ
jgi:predicted secreted protein